MGRSSKTVHILIVAAFAASVALGVYGWLTLRVLATSESITILESTIDTRSLEEEQLRSAERLLEATEIERAVLAALFVTEESVVSFIETIESLGRDAGVEITIASVETEEMAVDNKIGSVRIRLAAVGEWRDVVHFGMLIDALPFVVNILTAEFERSDSRWQSTFTLRVEMIK